jgi:hypothetical protein
MDGRIDALVSTLLGSLNGRGRFAIGLHRFLVFGIVQAWVCLFGGLMVVLLVATHLVSGQLAFAALRRVDPLDNRDSDRPDLAASGRMGGGQGDLLVPRCRHLHGAVQDRSGVVNVPGIRVFAHRRRAVF